MTSQFLNDKYHVLKAISEGCTDFDDIVWYSGLIPVRVRGFLRYFLTHNDISKSRKKPAQYELTFKGREKLNHWELKKK